MLNPQTLSYDALNAEVQIIKYASSEENIAGGVTLKISKTDTFLNTEELLKFTTYMEQVKFAGTRIDYVSSPADILTLSAVVFYDPLVSEASVRTSIDNSITAYLNEIGFNNVFRISDLIFAIKSLPEVSDASISQAEATQGFTSVISVSYKPKSGRLVYISGNSNIQLATTVS